MSTDRTGTCIACFTPTDTGVAVIGNIAWLIDTLRILGVPEDEARDTVHYSFDHRGVEPLALGRYLRMRDYEWLSAVFNHDPELHVVWKMRVCTRCAERASVPFPRPVLAIPGSELPQVTNLRPEDVQ